VFSSAFNLRPNDVVCLIGCGGKTSLLYRLARENRSGRVLLAATTKFLEPPKACYDRRLAEGETPGPGINLFGLPTPDGKLGGLPPGWLSGEINFDGLALLEADGSRQLPLKGWTDYEPVIPSRTNATIGIATLQPVGRVYQRETAHRPDLFQKLTGATPGARITLEHISAMISGDGGMFSQAAGRKILFINQIESPEGERLARRLARQLPPAFREQLDSIWAGSLLRGTASPIEGKTS